MARKRRYSEDFYTEIDALIKIQQEKSEKRFEFLEFARQSDENGKNENKDKWGYITPPSFLTVVKRNRLFGYMMIFMVILISVVVASSIYAKNIENGRRLTELGKKSSRKQANGNPSNKDVKLNPATIRANFEVAVKPVPGNWPKPQEGTVNPYINGKDKARKVLKESEINKITAIPIPGNIKIKAGSSTIPPPPPPFIENKPDNGTSGEKTPDSGDPSGSINNKEK